MIVLRLAGDLRPGSLTPILMIAHRFPGDCPLTVLVGDRSLTLGPGWSYDPSPACLAALAEFGDAEHVPA